MQNCCPSLLVYCASYGIQKAMAVKDIITKDKARGMPGNKFFPDDECLGQPLWLWLFRIIKGKTDLLAIPQKLFEKG